MAIDPFGVTGATGRLSQDIALRALAPFYPTDDKKISIVLVDDDSLNLLQRDYVLSYEDWRDLLDAIICAGPRAIFIDLIFLRPHEGYDRLPPELLRLLGRDGGTEPRDGCANRAPIFVADLVEGDIPSGFASTGNARELRLRSLTTPVNWKASDRSYPLWAGVKGDTSDHSAVPRAASGTWAGRCGDLVPYPALLLYLHSRAKVDPSGTTCALDLRVTGRMDDKWPPLPIGTEEMVISWGYIPSKRPEGYDQIVSELDCQQYSSVSSDIIHRTKISILQISMDFSERFKDFGESYDIYHVQPCLYFSSISAWKVIVDATSIPEHATEERASPLRLLFEDRYVLIGSHITGGHDTQVSPVHGQIPGVFMHAMALDNLLRYGSGVWRNPPTFWKGNAIFRAIEWSSIVEWISILCVVSVNHILLARGYAKLPRVIIGSLIPVGIAIFTAAIFLWAPVNWAGAILFSIPDLLLARVRETYDPIEYDSTSLILPEKEET